MQVHDRSPDKVNFDELMKEDYGRFSPYEFVDGDHFYTTFVQLPGLASNHYTYLLDKVIATDFFSMFDSKNLLDGPAALRYRRAVLEPGGSKPAAQLVEDFLGRPQRLDALKLWMEREFEPPQ
jgi:thimet oligopeptidase